VIKIIIMAVAPTTSQQQQGFDSSHNWIEVILLMESIYFKLNKYFATLDAGQKIDWLFQTVEQLNQDFSNDTVLRLQAAPRLNTIRPIYAGVCHCCHSSDRHWFLYNDFKNCKSCSCRGFYE
jgi:hypothetical protein